MKALGEFNDNNLQLDMTAYPYVYFPSLDYKQAADAASSAASGSLNTNAITEALQYTTCVKACPSKTSVVNCYAPAFMTN